MDMLYIVCTSCLSTESAMAFSGSRWTVTLDPPQKFSVANSSNKPTRDHPGSTKETLPPPLCVLLPTAAAPQMLAAGR